MKFFRLTLIIYIVLTSFNGFAQIDTTVMGKNDTIRVPMTNIDGVMVPWLVLNDVSIYGTRIFLSAEERAKFNRLRYNVLKVMPYAIFARDRYARLNKELSVNKDKKQQRQLTRACEKEIKDMFNDKIKNLTITQGGILIKLINRETGYTTYELAKEMKGGLNAFFYQSVARIFGNNLKEKYDVQEERDIEAIIQSTPYYYYRMGQ